VFRELLPFHTRGLRMADRQVGELIGESEYNFRVNYGPGFPNFRLVV
jgi:hypothetical protein